MASGHVNSAYIKAFPAAGRSSDYPEGFLTTEDNLSGVIKAIYPNNNSSFVIDKTDQKLDFVIQGYVFSITTSGLPEGLTTSGNLFAGIYLKNSLDEGSYKRLVSTVSTITALDEEGENGRFTGLILATTSGELIPDPAPSESTLYSLQLLADGQIPATSKFQYLIDSDITVSTTAHAGGNTLNIRIGKN